MRTSEVTATVTEAGTLTAHLRADILPSEHQVVAIDEEPVASAAEQRPLDLPVIQSGNWSPTAPSRQEDIYDEWGRDSGAAPLLMPPA